MTINVANNISATGLSSTAQPETQLSLGKGPLGETEKSPLNTNADFTTFLKMLTTQIQYQDPLSPVEANDFAVQLATFSSVEQQTKTNQLLDSLVSRSANGLSETAGWIGKIARTKAPVWFGQQPIEMELNPNPKANNASLKAIDSRGIVVHSQDVPVEKGLIEWYGLDPSDKKLGDGLYTFRLDSYNKKGEVIQSDKVSTYAHILETRVGKDGVELVFPGEASAKVSQIEALLEGGFILPPPPGPTQSESTDPDAL